jgi:hypothetical protein
MFSFPYCGCVLIVFSILSVEGSSLPREGVIWTKWLERLLLNLEQFRMLCNTTCLMVELATYHLQFLN